MIARRTLLGTLASLSVFAPTLLRARRASPPVVPSAPPIDPAATPETVALLANMKALSGRGVMFGHQNTLSYGYEWTGDADRSDVRDVTGDFPAVYGWDVGETFASGRIDIPDPGGIARLQGFVRAAHARGGVNTFSWHMPNPANDTDAWNTTEAVSRIIPGGDLHAKYTARLALAATFFKGLTDAQGRLIPVCFRPFHEHTGGWFWWGKGNARREDFIALWRFTVHYLRDVAGVHNLLYAYSTDVFDTEAQYFDCYPGDDCVDLLGFDDYHSIESAATRNVFVRRLGDVARWARARGKIAALTETGLEALPNPVWWTKVLLPGLAANRDTRAISYVLVWRNADHHHDRPNHFFAPYRGQASAADFVHFYDDPLTLFERDLPPLYKSVG